MIISHEHKFIFVHIHKCAGTSIGESLLPYLGEKDEVFGYSKEGEHLSTINKDTGKLWKHSTSKEIKDSIDPEIWNNYFKFAFVRSPWEIEISFYHWWKETDAKWDRKSKKEINNISFDKYILKRPWEHTILDFIVDKNSDYKQIKPKDIFAREYSLSNLNLNIDYLGRYETLEKDFAYLCGRFNLPNIELKHVNKSRSLDNRNATMSYYKNDKTKGRMYNKYYYDIAFLDYDLLGALGSSKSANEWAYLCEDSECPGHSKPYHHCHKN
tara:strand:- start:29772 stop:30578 length:807 start_codon:yes stop_codon:yes gene_type:complete